MKLFSHFDCPPLKKRRLLLRLFLLVVLGALGAGWSHFKLSPSSLTPSSPEWSNKATRPIPNQASAASSPPRSAPQSAPSLAAGSALSPESPLSSASQSGHSLPVPVLRGGATLARESGERPAGSGSPKQLKKELLRFAELLAQNSANPSGNFLEIATYYYKTGDHHAAFLLFTKAEKTAFQPLNPPLSNQRLYDVFRRYLQLKLSDHAESLAAQLSLSSVQQKAWRDLAQFAARQNRDQEALYFHAQITTPKLRGEAASTLILAQVARKELQSAKRTARGLKSNAVRDLAVQRSAETLAKSGNLETALDFSSLLSTPEGRDSLEKKLISLSARHRLTESTDRLTALANDRLFRKKKHAARVEELISEKGLAALSRERRGTMTRQRHIASLRLQAFYLGSEGALRAAEKTALQIPAGLQKDWTLAQLSILFGEKESIQEARKLADHISRPEVKEEALATLAGTAATRGDSGELQKTLASIQGPEAKARALSLVAHQYYKQGHLARASRTLHSLEKLAPLTKSSKEASKVISAQSQGFAQLGETLKADQKAHRITDPNIRDKTLQAIALHYAKEHNIDQAQQTLSAIQKPAIRGKTEAGIVETAAGNTRLAEAKSLTRQFKTRHRKILFLLSVARKA